MPNKQSTHLQDLRHLRRQIGRNIQSERVRKRITLEELANRSSVGAKTLDLFELGYKVIDLEMITHIARILNVPVSTFIRLEKIEEK